MPLIYSAVGRGPAVLAEYSVISGNFGAVARDYLAKAAEPAGRSSHTVDGHVFSFLAADGYSEWIYVMLCNVRNTMQLAGDTLTQLAECHKRRQQSRGGGCAVTDKRRRTAPSHAQPNTHKTHRLCRCD